jgi:hypothetical protein
VKHCESRTQIPDKTIFGYNGTLAQLVEHRTEDAGVTGSNPVGTTRAREQYLIAERLVWCI